MTEAEWLTEDDLEYLLDFFEENASRRKLRLFAVGCARRVFHLLTDESCLTAVEVAEAYADNRTTLEALGRVYTVSESALRTAWHDASCVDRDGMTYFAEKQEALTCDLAGVAQVVTKEEFNEVYARDAIDAINSVLAHSAIPPDQWGTSAGDEAAMRALEAEQPRQLQLFRDVFGNPFRPVSLQTAWLVWNDGTVARLAQAIYHERELPSGTLDNGRLAILADALEKAGCDNEELLAHLLGPGPHVRGCFAVDLLLGKD